MWDDYEVQLSKAVIRPREPSDTKWTVSGLVKQFKEAARHADGHDLAGYRRLYKNPNGGPDLVVSVWHAAKVIKIETIDELNASG